MESVQEEEMKTYFHTKIDKYQDKLDAKSPVVREDKGANSGDPKTTEREDAFNEMKEEIEGLFKYDGSFLLVETPKERRVCANAFVIEYRHDGYASGIRIMLFDVFRKKLIDVTTNSMVIKTYETNVTFKQIMEDTK